MLTTVEPVTIVVSHWKADCPRLRSKHRGSSYNVKPAAAAATLGNGCVSNGFSSVCEPDVLKAYAPFIRSGFVSLVGSDVKSPGYNLERHRGI